VIGQLPDLFRQIHTLPGTPTTQEVGGIRVPAVEGVQIALHTPLLLGGGLAAGELVEVLVEQEVLPEGAAVAAGAAAAGGAAAGGAAAAAGAGGLGADPLLLLPLLLASPSLVLISASISR